MLEKILFFIGGMGFISVFQAIGAGSVYYVYKRIIEGAFHKELSGNIVLLFLGVGFTVFPFFLAYEMGGVTQIIFQAVVFIILGIFLLTPYPNRKENKVIHPKNDPLSSITLEREKINLLRRIVVSLPCFLTALGYFLVLAGAPILGMDKKWLCA